MPVEFLGNEAEIPGGSLDDKVLAQSVDEQRQYPHRHIDMYGLSLSHILPEEGCDQRDHTDNGGNCGH